MASNFAQYTNGVVMPTGISEAGANIGQFAQRGLSAFGQSLGEGLQAYNENVAKDQVLQEEAKQLGSQIQQFAAQFGDSPEHKAFADSLQPYIQQLAKVPSMSLTQKMGAVTGVKAGFANIGQQLQVFELMRGERLKRDMNAARSGVREYDEVTVPTAIIPEGKLPYFYGKTYQENESTLVNLANQAIAKGAKVDIPSVLDTWRKQTKAGAMANPNISPELKEKITAQLDAAKGLESNVQTDESGITDYSKEAEMYGNVTESAKSQLAPKKVETQTQTDDTAGRKAVLEDTIAKLNAMKTSKTETISDAEFNKLADADPATSRFTKVESLKSQGWSRSTDENGKISWTKKTEDNRFNDALAIYNSELKKIDKQEKKKTNSADVVKSAESELSDVEKQIEELNKQIENEDVVSPTNAGRATQKILKLTGMVSMPLAKAALKDAIINSDTPLTAESIRGYLQDNNTTWGAVKQLASGAANIMSPAMAYRQAFGRTITKGQERMIEAEVSKLLENDPLTLAKFTGDTEFQMEALNAKKAELEKRVKTGIVNASSADLSKAQTQVAPQAQAQPEDEAITNAGAFNLGTTTARVNTSIEEKRQGLSNYFQNKYGYVPAGFEESFKAIYPEASFKTMETPYGAFFHDGKEWKQMQMKEPKVMTRKEQAEEKAVSFGKTIGGGEVDINQFGELVPNSGVYVRGIFGGSPTEAFKFKQQMLEASNSRTAVKRLTEINDMVGESMPWNSKLWGEAKALLPQIKAGLRTDIIGVGTVSNYEQQLIEEVVADPTRFWSLESSDRAKLAVIMDKINKRLIQEPANHGLEVKVAGQTNSEVERSLRMGRAGKSKLELDFEARGGKKGIKLDWGLSNKIPDALKD